MNDYELIAMNIPMRLLKEDPIFERIISIKYDVPNDNINLIDSYKKDVDKFYDKILAENA